MKVITLTAPWSWLAAARLKEFETRGWQTAYRGSSASIPRRA